MTTATISKYYPPKQGKTGKMTPALLLFEGRDHGIKVWDRDLPTGIGVGATIEFDAVQTGEYNGKPEFGLVQGTGIQVVSMGQPEGGGSPVGGDRDRWIRLQGLGKIAATALAAGNQVVTPNDVFDFTLALEEGFNREIEGGVEAGVQQATRATASGQQNQYDNNMPPADDDLDDDIPF